MAPAPAPATSTSHLVPQRLEKPRIDAPDAGRIIPTRTKCVLKLNARVDNPYSQLKSFASITTIILLP